MSLSILLFTLLLQKLNLVNNDVFIDYFNKLWDCPEGGSSNPGLGSGVHCSPWVRVDHGSNAIHVHPCSKERERTGTPKKIQN